jgi:hypothetical protein
MEGRTDGIRHSRQLLEECDSGDGRATLVRHSECGRDKVVQQVAEWQGGDSVQGDHWSRVVDAHSTGCIQHLQGQRERETEREVEREKGQGQGQKKREKEREGERERARERGREGQKGVRLAVDPPFLSGPGTGSIPSQAKPSVDCGLPGEGGGKEALENHLEAFVIPCQMSRLRMPEACTCSNTSDSSSTVTIL